MRRSCSGALGCTRQKSAAGRWARTCGGALSEDGLLLVLEADDLFALEIPLRRVMADFAAVHGVICGVSRPYGGTVGFQKADRSARAALRMAARTETPCVTDDPAGVVRLLEEASPAETDA